MSGVDEPVRRDLELGELLLAAAPRGELHLPKRGLLRRRSHTELT